MIRQVVAVADIKFRRPTLVVDAGRLVTENDELGMVLGDQGIEGVDVAFIAILEGGNFDRRVEQEPIAGVEGRPIGVFADVQGSKECSVVWNAFRELAERLSPASLNVDQLRLSAGALTHDTTSFVNDVGYS